MYDVIILGSGLAGIAAATFLSENQSVLLISDPLDTSAASAIPAGLFNTMMAQKANPVWKAEEALDALGELVSITGAGRQIRRTGIIRPAVSPKQAEHFRVSAERAPHLGEFFHANDFQERFPTIQSEFGGLLVHSGGSCAISTFVSSILRFLDRERSVDIAKGRVMQFIEESDHVRVEIRNTESFLGKRLLVAAGKEVLTFPQLRDLDIHPIKGQVIRVRLPAGFNIPIPVSSSGYLVSDGDQWVLGSTYEHSFSTPEPDEIGTQTILRKLSKVVPAVMDSTVTGQWAGIRVTVPGTRLPMVGPVTSSGRIWVFTGLGSKGILMAPLVARRISRYFSDPEAIPAQIRVTFNH